MRCVLLNTPMDGIRSVAVPVDHFPVVRLDLLVAFRATVIAQAIPFVLPVTTARAAVLLDEPVHGFSFQGSNTRMATGSLLRSDPIR